MTNIPNREEQGLSSESLPKRVFFSFLTQAVPILIALLVIPRLIGGLGDDRFGLLTLVWVFLGYFTLFDLGLGRATTKFVSEYVARGRHQEIPELIWTSWSLLTLLGLFAALSVYLLTPVLIDNVLNIPDELLAESERAFKLVAFSVPIVIMTTGIRAVLEAYQRFQIIASVTVPASLLTYLIPFLAIFFTKRLEIIIGLLLVNRLLFMGIHLLVCLKIVPNLQRAPNLNLNLLKPLVRFGGWLTVTNIIGPIMSYLDRFLIGSLLSVAQVTYYVTPYEMVRRLKVIPSSLMTVLFPTFSGLNATDAKQSSQLFHQAVRLLFLVACPIMLTFVILAEDLLTLWIDASFAEKSAPVLKWLAIGVLINFLAQVAYNWVQSVGRSDLTAKLHLFELPIYLTLIWFLARSLGIVGVAIAWTVRVGVDAALLFFLARRYLAVTDRNFRYLTSLGLLGIGFYAGATLLIRISPSIMFHFIMVATLTTIYSIIAWGWFLTPSEKRQMVKRIPWLRKQMMKIVEPN